MVIFALTTSFGLIILNSSKILTLRSKLTFFSLNNALNPLTFSKDRLKLKLVLPIFVISIILVVLPPCFKEIRKESTLNVKFSTFSLSKIGKIKFFVKEELELSLSLLLLLGGGGKTLVETTKD